MTGRYFNVAGPCFPAQHYTVLTDRCSGDISGLIEKGQYFVLHAARQTGKTTLLLDLWEKINAGGRFYALYCSLEMLQEAVDPQKSMPTLIDIMQNALRRSKVPHWEEFGKNINKDAPLTLLNRELGKLCGILDRPLVIFFDEADCLSDLTLISFLRQLRDGYVGRNMEPFAHSIALVGMRNIRDFKVHIRPESQTLGSASPFNVITKAMTLSNFTEDEIKALYKQHTDETGQVFEKDAVDLVWRETRGQPWLVNAIAREVVEDQLGDDHSKPVTAAGVAAAIQTIILRRDVHIDSLLDKLQDPRVRSIVEPIILGGSGLSADTLSNALSYTKDLGLIRFDEGKWIPSNPIYAEVIVRTLSNQMQEELNNERYPYLIPRYLKEGRIDMEYLLRDFQQFWRENSAIWGERFEYKEAAPHLILMAFLQRVINGGGELKRELAAETGRLDLCIEYEGRRYPIEVKLRYSAKTYTEGKEHISRYMESLDCKEGWLVVFDRRKGVSWRRKLFMRKERAAGKTIVVVGC